MNKTNKTKHKIYNNEIIKKNESNSTQGLSWYRNIIEHVVQKENVKITGCFFVANISQLYIKIDSSALSMLKCSVFSLSFTEFTAHFPNQAAINMFESVIVVWTDWYTF